MDAKQEYEIRLKLAQQVQTAMQNHKVSAEDLGSTASFLASVLGGMIAAVFPTDKYDEQIEAIRQDIKYGIEMGVPEE